MSATLEPMVRALRKTEMATQFQEPWRKESKRFRIFGLRLTIDDLRHLHLRQVQVFWIDDDWLKVEGYRLEVVQKDLRLDGFQLATCNL